MHNVIALANRRNTSDIYFPVVETPMTAFYNGEYFEDPTRKTILRTDTNQVLGVHKNSYKLVKNEDIFPQFEEALHHSALKTDGLQVKHQLSHSGAKTVRSYIFPEHTVDVNPTIGDKVSMELKVINSYDGSYAFQSMIGGNRLACLNGMVAFETFLQTYGKHTSRLDPSCVLRQMNKALEVYMQQEKYWQQWAITPIVDQSVINIINKIPGITEPLSEKLMGYYRDEEAVMGNTVWAMFNALTYWSTHEDVRSSSQGNVASIQLEREQRIRKAMQTTEFQALAAA